MKEPQEKGMVLPDSLWVVYKCGGREAAMQDVDLYRAILGIEAPWRVEEVRLDTETSEVHVDLAHAEGVPWKGRGKGVRNEWHLNFWGNSNVTSPYVIDLAITSAYGDGVLGRLTAQHSPDYTEG